VSAGSLLCTSCRAVWLSKSAEQAGEQPEGCLRCGGTLIALEEPVAPGTSGAPLLAVTQAAGALGRKVAAGLARLGVAQRLIVGDRDVAPRLAGVEVTEASYHDTDGMRRALTGAQTLFLVSAEESPDYLEQHVAVVDAAVDAGVERIVFVSALSAAANATFTSARDDFHTEEHARATRLPCTFLRPSMYFDLLPGLCSADGVMANGAGDGRVACVSPDDVADVALVVLTQDDHDGRTYDVTGPVAQSMAEIVHELALATGRPISYSALTPDEERSLLSGSGAADWQIEASVSRSAAIAAGEMEVVSDTVERLAGHESQTFSDYLRRHPESCAHIVAG
jgi:NAD(P)H dehydrogenase (quinone)